MLTKARSWRAAPAVAVCALTVGCGTVQAGTRAVHDQGQDVRAGQPAAATQSDAAEVCADVVQSLSAGGESLIDEVIAARSVTGKQLAEWMRVRDQDVPGMGPTDPTDLFPNFSMSEIDNICLFRVHGYSPPGPPGAYTEPVDGAIYIVRNGQPAWVDLIGPLDRLRTKLAALPS